MAYGDGMTVLGYEEKLDTEQGDKLRICRVTRNFLQHNPSAYGFVVPTEAMIVFLEELVTDLVVKLEKSEPAVYRLPPVKLTGTMRDAGKVFVKTGMSWLPVVDGTAVIETKRLRGTDVHEKLKRAMALGQCERSVKE